MAVKSVWRQKMRRVLLFLSVIACAPTYNLNWANASATGTTGTVQLDELSFDKVVNRFDVALVKFDVAFPYGDKQEAFETLAKEARDVDELLVAEVGVKDYGEKENEALALKYGAEKSNFPVVVLFVRGKDVVKFDESSGFTTDELRRFVREHAGLHLSMPGCVRKLDQIAIKFMQSRKETERTDLAEQAGSVIQELPEKEQVSGRYYKAIMEKVLEKGNDFVENEHQRVKKILGSKVSKEKKNELTRKLNILSTFQLNNNVVAEDVEGLIQHKTSSEEVGQKPEEVKQDL